jgi:hypothetical protein
MIVNAAVFTCSICGEPSTQICAYCTKDACANHRCVRCKRCSDCCECEVPLSAEEVRAEEVPAQEGEAEMMAESPAESASEPIDTSDPIEPPEPASGPSTFEPFDS